MNSYDLKKTQLIPTYNVDKIANGICVDRYDKGAPISVEIDKISTKISQIICDSKNMQSLYSETLRIPTESDRAENLSKLDRLLAERVILNASAAVEYPEKGEAKKAASDISRDYPNWQLQTRETAQNSYLFRQDTIRHGNDLNLIEVITSKDSDLEVIMQKILYKIKEECLLNGFIIQGSLNNTDFEEVFLNVREVIRDSISYKYFVADNRGEEKHLSVNELIDEILTILDAKKNGKTSQLSKKL